MSLSDPNVSSRLEKGSTWTIQPGWRLEREFLIVYVPTGNSVPSGLSAGTPAAPTPAQVRTHQKVFSQLRSDFGRDCCVFVDPMSVHEDVVSATSAAGGPAPPAAEQRPPAELIARVKDRLTRAFVRRCGVHEDEIRRLDRLRTGKGWDFWHFFLVKEGYALLLDQVNLAEDANKQYLELSVAYESTDDGTRDGDITVVGTRPCLDLCSARYREQLLRRSLPRCEFERYMFARQARLLWRMGRLEELLDRAREYMAVAARRLEAKPPSAAALVAACVSDVLRLCDTSPRPNDMDPTADAPGRPRLTSQASAGSAVSSDDGSVRGGGRSSSKPRHFIFPSSAGRGDAGTSHTIELDFSATSRLGMEIRGNEVRTVHANTQSSAKGIVAGWRIVHVDGLPVGNNSAGTQLMSIMQSREHKRVRIAFANHLSFRPDSAAAAPRRRGFLRLRRFAQGCMPVVQVAREAPPTRGIKIMGKSSGIVLELRHRMRIQCDARAAWLWARDMRNVITCVLGAAAGPTLREPDALCALPDLQDPLCEYELEWTGQGGAGGAGGDGKKSGFEDGSASAGALGGWGLENDKLTPCRVKIDDERQILIYNSRGVSGNNGGWGSLAVTSSLEGETVTGEAGTGRASGGSSRSDGGVYITWTTRGSATKPRHGVIGDAITEVLQSAAGQALCLYDGFRKTATGDPLKAALRASRSSSISTPTATPRRILIYPGRSDKLRIDTPGSAERTREEAESTSPDESTTVGMQSRRLHCEGADRVYHAMGALVMRLVRRLRRLGEARGFLPAPVVTEETVEAGEAGEAQLDKQGDTGASNVESKRLDSRKWLSIHSQVQIDYSEHCAAMGVELKPKSGGSSPTAVSKENSTPLPADRLTECFEWPFRRDVRAHEARHAALCAAVANAPAFRALFRDACEAAQFCFSEAGAARELRHVETALAHVLMAEGAFARAAKVFQSDAALYREEGWRDLERGSLRLAHECLRRCPKARHGYVQSLLHMLIDPGFERLGLYSRRSAQRDLIATLRVLDSKSAAAAAAAVAADSASETPTAQGGEDDGKGKDIDGEESVREKAWMSTAMGSLLSVLSVEGGGASNDGFIAVQLRSGFPDTIELDSFCLAVRTVHNDADLVRNQLNEAIRKGVGPKLKIPPDATVSSDAAELVFASPEQEVSASAYAMRRSGHVKFMAEGVTLAPHATTRVLLRPQAVSPARTKALSSRWRRAQDRCRAREKKISALGSAAERAEATARERGKAQRRWQQEWAAAVPTTDPNVRAELLSAWARLGPLELYDLEAEKLLKKRAGGGGLASALNPGELLPWRSTARVEFAVEAGEAGEARTVSIQGTGNCADILVCGVPQRVPMRIWAPRGMAAGSAIDIVCADSRLRVCGGGAKLEVFVSVKESKENIGKENVGKGDGDVKAISADMKKAGPGAGEPKWELVSSNLEVHEDTGRTRIRVKDAVMPGSCVVVLVPIQCDTAGPEPEKLNPEPEKLNLEDQKAGGQEEVTPSPATAATAAVGKTNSASRGEPADEEGEGETSLTPPRIEAMRTLDSEMSEVSACAEKIRDEIYYLHFFRFWVSFLFFVVRIHT